jgi:hypothetical protein
MQREGEFLPFLFLAGAEAPVRSQAIGKKVGRQLTTRKASYLFTIARPFLDAR